MRGITTALTIGERIAWYRQRRGMSQEVLANFVGLLDARIEQLGADGPAADAETPAEPTEEPTEERKEEEE